jgi:HSP20 family molecular chaperone IbpA
VFFYHATKPPNPWKDHATKQLENVLLVQTTKSELIMEKSWRRKKNHIAVRVPGFAKRSITLCRESVRKHIWHLCPL